MTCDEFEEISGAYVLDAITPAERQAAEAHLESCESCAHLLQELRGVVSLLPLSVPQINPSAALGERIISAVRRESQGIAAQPTRPIDVLRSAQPLQRTGTRPGRSNPRVLVAAAVLLLALLGGLGAWNVSLHGQVVTLQQQLTQANSHPPTSPIKSYAVKGTSTSQGVAGQLIYFAAKNITVLIVHGLPQLQGTHVYQGWLLNVDGQKKITGVISIGLLNPLNDTATLSFAGNVSGYDVAAISLETGPTATPNAPRGSVVAEGSLQ